MLHHPLHVVLGRRECEAEHLVTCLWAASVTTLPLTGHGGLIYSLRTISHGAALSLGCAASWSPLPWGLLLLRVLLSLVTVATTHSAAGKSLNQTDNPASSSFCFSTVGLLC
ncbi:unnamed protein product [Boreogadus saida]